MYKVRCIILNEDPLRLTSKLNMRDGGQALIWGINLLDRVGVYKRIPREVFFAKVHVAFDTTKIFKGMASDLSS